MSAQSYPAGVIARTPPVWQLLVFRLFGTLFTLPASGTTKLVAVYGRDTYFLRVVLAPDLSRI
ncbi:hypothetical protein OO7_07904 [Providencia sneebia DSM 19967]|uniref:Uncharacterized protein n=1 Tax=Providencia sneebia DSM 19967 TaxID=1141660 RepID=K8WMA9_9GAMM|nr:hypothetical protein OO7_07904 [Providencia sneebia DSM 19967]